MPTYNNGKYIEQAIESIYAQHYDNIEIIVVDDGSTDNTKEILQQYKDIKYFYMEHKGISAARNLALEKSKGEYIAFCDSDDYWLPEKINTQLQYFKNNPDCKIVFTKYKNIFETADLKQNKRALHEQKVEDIFKKYLATSIVRKELFDEYGNFVEKFKTGEDSEFVKKKKKKGINVEHYIEKAFYVRRLHGNNITLRLDPPYMQYVTNFLRRKILERDKRK